VAKQCGVPATQFAIDNFFKILQRHPVPIEDVDKTLREIAQRYKELLKKTEALTSDDPDVQNFQQEATKALEKLDFETADKLLNQAQEKDAVAIRAMEEEQQRLQEALNKRLLSRATTLVTLAKSKDAQLAYRDTARYYQEAAKLLPVGHETEVSLYLNNAGLALYNLGEYKQAKPLYEEALKIREWVLGKQHPAYATSLNNLAGLYTAQGEYEKAKPLFEEALKIVEPMLGKQHPAYATSLNNLAGLYTVQGEYEKAKPLFEEALKIVESMLGKQHPAYATALNNLAALYESQGKYGQAKPLYEEALKIYEQVLGKQHPDYALSLNNLATLYKEQGEYEQAKPLYEEALKIREQVLGKQHPDTAQSLNNLALLYELQGKVEQAKPLYEKVLKIREQVLGKQHPDTAQSLNNLATLYKKQGEYEQAKPLYEEALKITEQMLGKQHPLYAFSLNNLAGLYESQGEYEKALPLLKEAVTIVENKLGKNHPNTKTITENLHRVQLHLNSQFQVIVKAILHNSQAEQLGIQVGDIFTHYNNKFVLGASHFIYIYGRSKEPAAGPAKQLKVLREGKELVFKVKPGKMGVELEERVKSK